MSQRLLFTRPPVLTSERLARICEDAVVLLTTHGLRVMHPPALEAAARTGLRVVNGRVFPERGAVEAFLAKERARGKAAPNAPDPAAPLTLHVSEYADWLHDLEADEIVPCTEAGLIEATKLIDALADEGVNGAAPGYPHDVPDPLSPLLKYKVQAHHSRQGRAPVDHSWAQTLPWVMEMAEVLGHPVRSLPVYVVTPLAIGAESLESVLNVVPKLTSIWTSNMPSVGAATSLHIAHALALGLAEVAGSALVLHAITGLPVNWRVTAMAFDMRTMTLALAQPEQRLFTWAAEELNAFCQGRELWPPWSWGNFYTGAKLPGVQAAAEKMSGGLTAALLGAQELHGAGSLGGAFSAEQLIIDCELRDHIQRVVGGVDTELGSASCLEEIAAGLGHGFIGLDSTLDHYRDVYWFPMLFAKRATGSDADLRTRAKQRAREVRQKHSYELPAELAREVDRIYARAAEELGCAATG